MHLGFESHKHSKLFFLNQKVIIPNKVTDTFIHNYMSWEGERLRWSCLWITRSCDITVQNNQTFQHNDKFLGSI